MNNPRNLIIATSIAVASYGAYAFAQSADTVATPQVEQTAPGDAMEKDAKPRKWMKGDKECDREGKHGKHHDKYEDDDRYEDSDDDLHDSETSDDDTAETEAN